ncbi:MAG: formate dehydrogenase accessory sulfurtransferase FdhD [Thermoanaerobaculia bacterium]|nr:MAG: formate dehydrogenase accessory sulfurtransferase FdhD [Thermoanaerobaculia bacterium]MBZ0101405.1 formate dehydrogenase accessory sulfurtransferase FdhD [Thermoanaerobaculia bacterium]
MSVESPAPESVAAAPVVRWRGGAGVATSDRLAVEAPLELRLDGRPFTVLMRTPGDDEELAAGFLFSEGIVTAANQIRALARPPDLPGETCRNFLDVDLAPEAAGRRRERGFYASASCGVCGKSSIADLAIVAPEITASLAIDRALLGRLPARLRERQVAFAATGGLHGAGLFSAAGEALAVREDIGRHNAVDKLIGWALAGRGLPLSDVVLVVSGRLGFEIVQKAVVAGVPVVAGVGAASTLAVALAERFGLTLVSFLRKEGFNLFGETSRVVGTDTAP